MKMLLMREKSTHFSTPGTIWMEVPGQEAIFRFYSIEDVVRADPKPETPANEAKVKGQTAIPAGEYRVIISNSPRLNKYTPELLAVPGFSGVRIHSGNTAEDSEGCILVGKHRANLDLITESRAAFADLMDDLRAAIARGESLHLRIEDVVPEIAKGASA